MIEDLMQTLGLTTEGTDTQQDTSRYSNGSTTIETLYAEFIAPKDRQSSTGRFRAKLSKYTGSSNDENDPLKVYPKLETAVAELKGTLSAAVFLIDDSQSMSDFQDPVAMTVRVLAYLIKKGDVDPDRNIELYFASQIGQKIENQNSKPLEAEVKDWRFDAAECEMGTVLEDLFPKILPNGSTSSPKPVSIYVLTNGLWSYQKPTSLCRVDEAIEKALVHLDENNAQLRRRWLGIQFIGFFDKEPSAEIGRRRLKFLDDKLCDMFESLGLNIKRR
ncbi:hypothetical protein LQW54_006406 [Pestalotiopsis sp. IQ-011]